MPEPLLHIYGQYHPHGEAYLVGNREGLLALRDAIDKALNEEAGVAGAHVAPADRETYPVIVIYNDDVDKLGLLGPTYCEPETKAFPWHPDNLSGFDLVPPDTYTALMRGPD